MLSAVLFLAAIIGTAAIAWRVDREGCQCAEMDPDALVRYFEIWLRQVFIDPMSRVFTEALHEMLADPGFFDGIETPWCKPHWTFINHRLWRLSTGEPVADL